MYTLCLSARRQNIEVEDEVRSVLTIETLVTEN